MSLEPWMVLPLSGLVYGLLYWAGKSDTEVGRRIRASDHAAWEYAMERKQRELDQLRAAEPGASRREE